jgi:hypothetical protein
MNKKTVEFELDLPEIQSAGPPPAAHADRVVAEMLHFLARFHGVVLSNLESFFSNARDGNPKAQAKLVEQIKKIGFPLVKSVLLRPGKRGRYRLDIFHIGSVDPVSRKIILENDFIPAKSWLALNVLLHESLGRGVYEHHHFTIVYVTHHALSRLCQRCGARTVVDLLVAVSDMCLAYIKMKNQDFLDGTRLPFENGVAVLNHDDDEKRTALIVTVLDQQGGA